MRSTTVRNLRHELSRWVRQVEALDRIPDPAARMSAKAMAAKRLRVVLLDYDFELRGFSDKETARFLATTDREFAERFWSKVDTDGDCWVWTGTAERGTYGQVGGGGIRMPATHAAWMLANLTPVPDGKFVCHRCDNPPCVRPDHLYVGDQFDNMADRRARGGYDNIVRDPETVLRGEDHWAAKLNESDVLEIRRLFAQGQATTSQLADRFGLSQSSVGSIVRRENWTHVPPRPGIDAHSGQCRDPETGDVDCLCGLDDVSEEVAWQARDAHEALTFGEVMA